MLLGDASNDSQHPNGSSPVACKPSSWQRKIIGRDAIVALSTTGGTIHRVSVGQNVAHDPTCVKAIMVGLPRLISKPIHDIIIWLAATERQTARCSVRRVLWPAH